MKFGVVIPSRLAPRPGGQVLESFGPELWLDGALGSVRRQAGYNESDWQIVVGVDPAIAVPVHIYSQATVVSAAMPGQAAAVNAAAAEAARTADVLAILEDDDLWQPQKTAIQLEHLVRAPFVSCSQRLIAEDRTPVGVGHYPSPSGWFMTAALWAKVGGFDERLHWFMDADWLGRLNGLGSKRIHITALTSRYTSGHNQEGLFHVGQHASVATYGGFDLLVDRSINGSGATATTQRDKRASEQAERETTWITQKYGGLPW